LAQKVDGISAASGNQRQRDKRLDHPVCGRLDFGDPFFATNDLCLYRSDGVSHSAREWWGDFMPAFGPAADQVANRTIC
jgi:hypothetical protein